MDNEIVVQGQSLGSVLADLTGIFLAVISRPVVQQQILALFIILAFTWLLPGAVRRWRRQHAGNSGAVAEDQELRKHRRRKTFFQLLTPVLTLILLNITIWLFARQGIPNGLLIDITNLIWLWIFYRLLLTVLYAKYGEAVNPYCNRILTPIFLVILLLGIFNAIPGSVTLSEAIISLGTLSITFGNLASSIILFYIFSVTAWIIKEIMMHTLPSRLNAESGFIESAATLTRYSLLALGVILSLGALGLNFTSLAIIAGGLSVGIGIGLQDIISNFVSGLVLLFEQSLRPGDVVELDGRISQVENISLRATTVRTRTNEELIIPNSKFTTEQVKNLTKSDRLVQVLVPFGVSYKSDPEDVRELAVETSLGHSLVLKDPAPLLIFKGYGDSSLDFSLVVSVTHPEMIVMIRSDLYYMLWRAFAEYEIEIPYPQRDLNLREGWEPLTMKAPNGT